MKPDLLIRIFQYKFSAFIAAIW